MTAEVDEYNDLLTRAKPYLAEEGPGEGAADYGQVVLSPYEEVRAKARRYLRGLPKLPAFPKDYRGDVRTESASRSLHRRKHLRHGDHDQSDHNPHGGGGGSEKSYSEKYGSIVEESTAGESGEFAVAVTESGDFHLAYDSDPRSQTTESRDVFVELDAESASALADELDWAHNYDTTGAVADDDGIVDSVEVAGMDGFEVAVYESGDVAIINTGAEQGPRQGQGSIEMSSEDAADLATSLNVMADFYQREG